MEMKLVQTTKKMRLVPGVDSKISAVTWAWVSLAITRFRYLVTDTAESVLTIDDD